MPCFSRKLPMLAVLVLTASLQPIVAFAQGCPAKIASGDPRILATHASGGITPADQIGVADMKGQYAFQLNGSLTTPGIASRATAAVGSFTADGLGNITAGEMDFTSTAATFQALPITGTYTLDGDSGIGTLNLTSAKGSESFAFYGTDDGAAIPSYASGALVETDGGPVASSGSFYLQAPQIFHFEAVHGFWQMALTGQTFVTEGTPSPILFGGAFAIYGDNNFLTGTRRAGSGTPEVIGGTLVSGLIDENGRVAFTGYESPIHLAAYIIDVQHILIVSTDSPQVNPLMSGTIVRNLSPQY